MMKLDLECAPAITNPDDRAIATALAALEGYAILSRSELTYIQTARSGTE